MTNRSLARLAWPVAILVVIGLLVSGVYIVAPLLPQQAQSVLIGTIDTVPGSVDDLFRETGTGPYALGSPKPVSHDDVDAQYVTAASIWPWTLPPDWGFPKGRGVADTPGGHWNGMGIKAAFSLWASASLGAVKSGALTGSAAEHMLDQVEAATERLLAERLLTDRGFIANSVTPLRS